MNLPKQEVSLNIKFKVIFIFIISFLNYNCNTTDLPPAKNYTLKISLEDVSCTEAWLKLETENLDLPAQINLLVDDKLKSNYTISTNDTILYIDSLLSNKTYNIHTSFQPINSEGSFGQTNVKSNEVSVTTLDTTSHNFTWQSWTFGGELGAGSSYLNDAAIIDENNIWAVGAIYLKDSLGNPDPNAYNAVHWNGSDWELKRIMFYTICGQQSRSSYPAKSIFAFNDNDILIALDGSQIAKIENGIQTQILCLPWSFSINKIWGTSSEDLYVVGNGGNIAHYDGISWQKIESGTEIDLKDIYSTPDGQNIWACGWDNTTGDKVILQISRSTTEIIYQSSYNYISPYIGKLNSLWTDGAEFIVGGSLLFRHSIYNKKKVKAEFIPITDGSILFEPGNFIWKVRGSEKNNIFIGGDNGMVWHYNGVSWYKITDLYNDQFDRRIFGLAVTKNTIVAVGWKNSSAWIITGKK